MPPFIWKSTLALVMGPVMVSEPPAEMTTSSMPPRFPRLLKETEPPASIVMFSLVVPLREGRETFSAISRLRSEPVERSIAPVSAREPLEMIVMGTPAVKSIPEPVVEMLLAS